MGKDEIIARYAREKRVEQMVRNICKGPAADLDDLCGIIYLALLEKPEELIVRGDEEGWLPYFVVNMVRKQWYSDRSSFRAQITRFQRRSSELTQQMADEITD